MAANNFARALRRVLKYEGRLSMDRHDRGNWTSGKIGVGQLKGTNFGISAMAYPDVDIRNLTEEKAGFYYRRDYWHPCGADNLPSGVDLAVFDAAVNSGTGRARSWLKAALKRSGGDAVRTVKAYCDIRRGFLKGLRTFSRYGRGWLRRVADVEATGVRWALEAGGKKPAEVQAELRKESKSAGAAAKKNGKSAGGAVGGAAAGGGVVGSAPPDQPELWVALVMLAVALAVVGFIFWHRRRAKQEAAQAYNAEANRVMVSVAQEPGR